MAVYSLTLFLLSTLNSCQVQYCSNMHFCFCSGYIKSLFSSLAVHFKQFEDHLVNFWLNLSRCNLIHLQQSTSCCFCQQSHYKEMQIVIKIYRIWLKLCRQLTIITTFAHSKNLNTLDSPMLSHTPSFTLIGKP